MEWQDHQVRVCLDRPPRLVHTGVHTHRGGTTGAYRLPDFWCLHCYRYRATVGMGGVALPIRPNYVGFTPPGVEAAYQWPTRAVHACVHFVAVPEDAEGVRFPLMQDLGDDFEPLYRQFEEAVTCWSTQPHRAEARVWEVLWQLAERTPVAAGRALHPAVRQAVRLIELGLGEELRVAALADEVGLSHNQLTRLFRDSFGTTVVGFIRQRRVERARHLLEHSGLPIKAIAAEVGLPDLHQFNKTVRRELGRPPREVREERRR